MTMPDSMLADVILASPPIVRLGLAAPSERVRAQAARELACRILASLDGGGDDRRGQASLPL